MKSLIDTTIGVEVEYSGPTNRIAHHLHQGGWCAWQEDYEQHDYHCTCSTCHPARGLLWRHQRDSTVSGEFITRILHDWATARHAFDRLEDALVAAGLNRARLVTLSTGLHVHVAASYCEQQTLLAQYLHFEQFIQQLGSGPFRDKREGMNMTFLDGLRHRLSHNGERARETIETYYAARHLYDQIIDDRHIDLNVSGRNGTYEFRVYNSTTYAWQMELAARLSVAFCRASLTGALTVPQIVRIPPRALHTLRPPCDMETFIDVMCEMDEDLEPLIDMQVSENPIRPLPPIEPEPEQPPRSGVGPVLRRASTTAQVATHEEWLPAMNGRTQTVTGARGEPHTYQLENGRWVLRDPSEIVPDDVVLDEEHGLRARTYYDTLTYNLVDMRRRQPDPELDELLDEDNAVQERGSW